MNRSIFAWATTLTIIIFANSKAQYINFLGSTLWHQANGVQVVGNYAYCAFKYGIVILDISDRTAPQFLGQCPLTGEGKEIAVWGNYAYLAEGNGGLKVVDIYDPQNPVRIAEINRAGYVEDVATDGQYLYMACGESFYDGDNILIVDIADPTQPNVVGHCFVSSEATGISVQGAYAYATSDAGLSVIAIRPPESPHIVATLGFQQDFPYGLCVSGNYAYVASYLTNLRIINISNPALPSITGSIDLYDVSWDVAVSGQYAYLASGYQGLYVVNVANASAPVLVDSLDTADLCWGLFVDDNYAYLADRNNGFLAVNITNPHIPVVSGTYASAWYPNSIQISGQYAFIADAYDCLWVVDIDDLLEPRLAYRYNCGASIYTMALSDTLIFAACGYQGFRAYDISDPINPSQIGSYSGVYALDLAVSGRYAYVSDATSRRLAVFDIANPRNLHIDGQLALSISVRGICLLGNTLAINDLYDIKTIDISDPIHPALLGTYNVNSIPNDMAAFGWRYILVLGNSAVTILDIADPANPELVTTIQLNSFSEKFCVTGNLVYICTDEYMAVYDISNPRAPVSRGTYGNECHTVTATNDYIYLGEPYSFTILTALRQPDATESYQIGKSYFLGLNYPNPFNAQTTISYSLFTRSNVSIEIFDIAGRKLETLQGGYQEAGEHSIVWNAKDRASGVYFYRLRAGETSQTQKCILLK